MNDHGPTKGFYEFLREDTGRPRLLDDLLDRISLTYQSRDDLGELAHLHITPVESRKGNKKYSVEGDFTICSHTGTKEKLLYLTISFDGEERISRIKQRIAKPKERRNHLDEMNPLERNITVDYSYGHTDKDTLRQAFDIIGCDPDNQSIINTIGITKKTRNYDNHLAWFLRALRNCVSRKSIKQALKRNEPVQTDRYLVIDMWKKIYATPSDLKHNEYYERNHFVLDIKKSGIDLSDRPPFYVDWVTF